MPNSLICKRSTYFKTKILSVPIYKRKIIQILCAAFYTTYRFGSINHIYAKLYLSQEIHNVIENFSSVMSY